MKSALMALSALLLCGCATLPGTGVTSAADVARDAAALNDAYSRAASGQILLNVLRARDRWPREYLTLGGVTNQPTASFSAGITFNPLPLNGANDPLRSSEGPVSRTQSSAYSYSVTPMPTASITQTVLTPIGRDTFEHYWGSRWSRDVLLLVMAESIQRYTGGAVGPDDVAEGGATNWGRIPRAALQELVNEGETDDWSRAWPNSPTADESASGDPCEPDETYAGGAWPDQDRRQQRSVDVPAQGDRAVALDHKTDRCVFFQIVHRMADYSFSSGHTFDDVRLREVPQPTCRETTSVSIAAGSERLIRSMTETAATSGGRMVMRMEAAPRGSAYATAAGVVLARCPAEANEPVLLEIVEHVATPGGGTREHVKATYLVQLRSLDDMIYSMGRLIRSETPVNIARAEPCLRDEPSDATCVTAPLFAVREGRLNNPLRYAAFVDYQGDRYLAGPPIRSPVDDPTDRTATVLTLLAQLFALNFSPGSDAAPPSRVNTN
jgi:hypothetical protein